MLPKRVPIPNFIGIRPQTAEIYTFEVFKNVFFSVLWRHVTWFYKFFYDNLKPIFNCTYISNFIRIRPQTAEIYTFEVFKNVFFSFLWRHVTLFSKFIYSSIKPIFNCTCVSNFIRIRPQTAEIYTFEVFKNTFFSVLWRHVTLFY